MQSYKGKKYHFVGVGGCGMSALAAVLKYFGAEITGSDKCDGIFTRQLKKLGIPVYIGHNEGNLSDCDLVVRSCAVSEDNCEVAKSKQLGIDNVIRGQMLGKLLSDKKVIAVAGSHGKTSTVAFLTWLLYNSEFSFSTLVGGFMNNFDSNFVAQNSQWVVTEADESDNTMNCLEPEILILLNIDDDHIDHYGDQDKMIAEYQKLASKTKKAVFLNANDQILKRIGESLNGKAVYYGNSESYYIDESSIQYFSNGTKFILMGKSGCVGEFFISVAGRYFFNNFLAAFSVAVSLGVPVSNMMESAPLFKGVKRRNEEWGEINGIKVIEDYAHHPTEISAMLESVSLWHTGRIICVFQPHRYTRSKHIASSLAGAFSKADFLILTDIYSADEPPIDGITGEFVYNEVRKSRLDNVLYVKDIKNIIERLSDIVCQGDIVIFMGAGSIGSLACEFVSLLRNESLSVRR